MKKSSLALEKTLLWVKMKTGNAYDLFIVPKGMKFHWVPNTSQALCWESYMNSLISVQQQEPLCVGISSWAGSSHIWSHQFSQQLNNGFSLHFREEKRETKRKERICPRSHHRSMAGLSDSIVCLIEKQLEEKCRVMHIWVIMWQRHEKGIRDGKESCELDVILTRFHEEGGSCLSFSKRRGPEWLSQFSIRLLISSQVMVWGLWPWSPSPHVRLSAGRWSSVLAARYLRFSLSLSLAPPCPSKKKKKKGRKGRGRSGVEKRGGAKPGRWLEKGMKTGSPASFTQPKSFVTKELPPCYLS